MAPLHAHGRTFGILQLLALGDARPFTADDADLVATLAQHAALAVQNAQLVSSLQQELAQRVESGARLEASELRYRSMFEGSPVPLWVIDRESHRFLAVNEAAIDAYGYSHDEFLAMTIFDIRPASEFGVCGSRSAGRPRRAAFRHLHPPSQGLLASLGRGRLARRRLRRASRAHGTCPRRHRACARLRGAAHLRRTAPPARQRHQGGHLGVESGHGRAAVERRHLRPVSLRPG
ncbi:MAG: PAS domain-containing protein [Gemmatimonadetes bacterium]|nr:PAS domain-containing protein [Gemmatimonadota bacterium]